jgi:glyoxylase-like metal-dependent hydrolase (beta-lactamase superfamily II)
MSSKHAWDTRILRAGSFRLDGGSMFGVIPKPIWSKWSEPDAENRIGLNCNCAVLRDGKHTVLVETGYGSKWTEKDRRIFAMEERTVVDALEELSLSAEDISHVILSHLHFDHAGALTHWKSPAAGDSGGLVPTFPNAELIVQEQELTDALDNRSTMTRTYLRSHLDPVLERFRVVRGEEEPLPGIGVRPVPGHTWGQQAIQWSDQERSYVFAGDLCPTLKHAHPAASMAYDMEPWTSMRNKQVFFEACEREDLTIVLDHEPGDPLARVARSDENTTQYHLEPLRNS